MIDSIDNVPTREQLAQSLERAGFGRSVLRALAVSNHEAIKAAAAAGQNVHQLAIDHRLAFDASIARLPPVERTEAAIIYLEEVTAVTSHAADRDAARRAEDAQFQASVTGGLGIVAFCVIAYAVSKLF